MILFTLFRAASESNYGLDESETAVAEGATGGRPCVPSLQQQQQNMQAPYQFTHCVPLYLTASKENVFVHADIALAESAYLVRNISILYGQTAYCSSPLIVTFFGLPFSSFSVGYKCLYEES
eukprot:3006380-Pleurochrysis_carterae.AAC.1